jgi:hypothetical protein
MGLPAISSFRAYNCTKMAGTENMTAARVYSVRCPTKCCPDRIALPPRILPERLSDQPSPSKNIWPINYLCNRCGQTSVIREAAIRPEVSGETRDQNQLIRYLFSNGLPKSLKLVRIYTKENKDFDDFQQTGEQALERILLPSKLWDDSYGPSRFVRVETAAEIQD